MARKTTPTLSEASEAFQRIRARASGSRGVIYGYRSILGRLVQHTGDIRTGSLKPEHFEEFFYGVNGLAETCSRTTLARYRNDIKQFLNWLHRRGWTEHTGDYLLGGITEKSTKPNRDRFRLTADQLVRLMDAANDPRDRCLIAFVANTAVRIGEALNVRLKDVRLERGEVYVRRTKTREEVTYPITADLDEELRVWLRAYTEACPGVSGAAYLFPARYSCRFQLIDGRVRPVQPPGYRPEARIQGPRTIILPIAARAGIELEPGDGWHTIRRSVSRIFFEAATASGHDAALRLTQALLGHKHSQTTEGYLGLDIERRTVDKLLRGQRFIGRTGAGNVVNLRDGRKSA